MKHNAPKVAGLALGGQLLALGGQLLALAALLLALAGLSLASAPALSAQAGDGPQRTAAPRAPWSFGLGAGLGAGMGNLARSGDPGMWDVGPVLGVRVGRRVAGGRFGLLVDYPAFKIRDRAGNRGASAYLLTVTQVSFDDRAAQIGLGLSHHRREDEGILPSSRIGWAAGASMHQALRPDLGLELGVRFGSSSAYSSQLISLQLVRHWRW